MRLYVLLLAFSIATQRTLAGPPEGDGSEGGSDSVPDSTGDASCTPPRKPGRVADCPISPDSVIDGSRTPPTTAERVDKGVDMLIRIPAKVKKQSKVNRPSSDTDEQTRLYHDQIFAQAAIGSFVTSDVFSGPKISQLPADPTVPPITRTADKFGPADARKDSLADEQDQSDIESGSSSPTYLRGNSRTGPPMPRSKRLHWDSIEYPSSPTDIRDGIISDEDNTDNESGPIVPLDFLKKNPSPIRIRGKTRSGSMGQDTPLTSGLTLQLRKHNISSAKIQIAPLLVSQLPKAGYVEVGVQRPDNEIPILPGSGDDSSTAVDDEKYDDDDDEKSRKRRRTGSRGATQKRVDDEGSQPDPTSPPI
jgi:hypothetical protein